MKVNGPQIRTRKNSWQWVCRKVLLFGIIAWRNEIWEKIWWWTKQKNILALWGSSFSFTNNGIEFEKRKLCAQKWRSLLRKLRKNGSVQGDSTWLKCEDAGPGWDWEWEVMSLNPTFCGPIGNAEKVSSWIKIVWTGAVHAHECYLNILLLTSTQLGGCSSRQ